MVYGVEKYKEAFAAFQDCYVVIGGTACDAVLAGSRMRARATDDIDMIVVVEKLTPEFVETFWKFIKAVGENPHITQEALKTTIGKSISTVKRLTINLQKKGILVRKNGKRDGYWEVLS